MNIQEAKIGDAILIEKRALNLKNEYAVGIVRTINKDTYGKINAVGIEFLTETINGHNLCGKLDNSNGWFIFKDKENNLSIIEKNEFKGFKIGDRVKSVHGVGRESVVGATGTVVGFTRVCVGVLFDKEYDISGHDFYSVEKDKQLQADRNNGWFCLSDDIKKISEQEPQNTEKEAEPQEPEKAESKDADSIFDSYIEQVPKQYIYVARDMDGKLFAYIDEPIIDIGRMQYYAKRYKKINDKLFPELRYEKGILNVKTKEIIVK